MRWRYCRASRRLLVWDAPADLSIIRSLVQGHFQAEDVAAIIFYDAEPTTVVLRGRYLDRIIWETRH
jgi:hypothetical protein